jgi:hypothetical protein
MSLTISTHPVEEPPSPPAGERPEGAGSEAPKAPEAGYSASGEAEAAPPAATGGQEEQCCLQPLNCSFEDDTVLPLEPIAEGNKPDSPSAEEGELPGQTEPPRRGKLSPEERAQKKREAQRRYYLKKKAAQASQVPEEEPPKAEPPKAEPPKAEPEVASVEVVAEPPAQKAAPKAKSKSRAKPKAKAPPRDVEDLAEPLTPPPIDEADEAPRPNTVPLDLRLTPHLRSRALLRRDHESRSSRYANLFSGVLPA